MLPRKLLFAKLNPVAKVVAEASSAVDKVVGKTAGGAPILACDALLS